MVLEMPGRPLLLRFLYYPTQIHLFEGAQLAKATQFKLHWAEYAALFVTWA